MLLAVCDTVIWYATTSIAVQPSGLEIGLCEKQAVWKLCVQTWKYPLQFCGDKKHYAAYFILAFRNFVKKDFNFRLCFLCQME